MHKQVLSGFFAMGVLAAGGVLHAAEAPAKPTYAVVLSKATNADPAWEKVAAALVARHGASKLVYDRSPSELLPALSTLHPQFTCFVAPPAEAGRNYIAEINRLVRRYDDDPYTDTIWGVLTGYDAQNALAIASYDKPLTIHKVAAGTEVALNACEQGKWFCELAAGKIVAKGADGATVITKGPTDSTKAIVETLNEYQPDLFVTSGHATERNWQIGFRYKNGYFRSKAGELFGQDTANERHPVQSSNPKVYLAVGNCLMGHIDTQDAMALAWFKSAGVHQMVGYTVTTWYGYSGWGMLDYFVEQPGRYTAAEAFHVNQLALEHRLNAYFPELAAKEPAPGETDERPRVSPAARKAGLSAMDGAGLLHDRDVVAFYGDPAWQSRMADAPKAFDQTLTRQGDVYTLTIKPNLGAKSFDPVNTNGAQRGGRPIVQMLTSRIGKAEVLDGSELSPVISDDFILIPNPAPCDPAKQYVVRFKATEMK